MFLKDTHELSAEVAQLESQLADARAQLAASEYPSPPSSHPNSWVMKGTCDSIQFLLDIQLTLDRIIHI
jgi:urease accessory protein